MNRLAFVAIGAAALICAGGGVAVAGNHPAPSSPRPHDGHDYVTYSKSAPAVIPSSSCVATPTLEHTKPAPTSPSPTHTAATSSAPHTSGPASGTPVVVPTLTGTPGPTSSAPLSSPALTGGIGTATTVSSAAPVLANTGMDTGESALLGGGVLLVGSLLTLAGRRRRNH